MLLKDYPCDLGEMMIDWKVSDRHRRCTSVLAFSYEALLLVLILISTYELISLADNSVLYNAPCKLYIENCCQHLNHSLCKNQSGDTETGNFDLGIKNNAHTKLTWTFSSFKSFCFFTEMIAVQPSSKACSKEWSTVKILNFIVSSQLLVSKIFLLGL